MKTIAPRSLVLLPAFVMLACGGSGPEATTAPAPSAEASAGASSAPAEGGDPSATPAPSGEASAGPAAPAAPEPKRAPPTVTGTLLGKAFKPVGACVIGTPKKGTVAIEIYDVKDFDVKTKCGVLPPGSGGRKLGLTLAWKDGDKLDLATLKADKNPDGYVMEALAGKKFSRKDAGKDWKPKGSLDVVRGPATKGGVGRIRVSMTNGQEKLEGEIDVEVPMDLTESWAAAP